ncbi:MAG: hypothetical protein HY716_18580 [Planctomycetes bacterium]|nr:hypothetical protein [Planctomycetota bacterium]
MKIRFALAIAAVAFVAQPAYSQDDPEQVKKNIMAVVKKRLEEERAKILEQISKILDEELSRQKPADKPAEKEKEKEKKPADEKKAEDPASREGDKKARDIERKLAQLDEQRDNLQRDLRAIKRASDDAKIIKDAKENPPEDGQAMQEEFQEYFQAHNDKEYKDSIKGFKRLYHAFHESDNRGARRFAATSAYNVCCGYALVGDKEEALDWLELSIKAGFDTDRDFDHMRQDSDLDSLRKERRYLKLMADR